MKLFSIFGWYLKFYELNLLSRKTKMEISLFLKKKIHIIRVIKYVNRIMALPSMNLNLNFIFVFFFYSNLGVMKWDVRYKTYVT